MVLTTLKYFWQHLNILQLQVKRKLYSAITGHKQIRCSQPHNLAFKSYKYTVVAPDMPSRCSLPHYSHVEDLRVLRHQCPLSRSVECLFLRRTSRFEFNLAFFLKLPRLLMNCGYNSSRRSWQEARMIQGGRSKILHLENFNTHMAISLLSNFIEFSPHLNRIAKEYPFKIDPFQDESILCLESGESVLVTYFFTFSRFSMLTKLLHYLMYVWALPMFWSRSYLEKLNPAWFKTKSELNLW